MSDVPFCILGGTALSEGIGEILTPLAIPPDTLRPHVLLVKPRTGVSTAVMYRALDSCETAFHPDTDAYVRELLDGGIPAAAPLTANIFESVVVPQLPVIEKIKGDLSESGALAACMSGSGPTVFGLFESESGMLCAADRISRASYADELAGIFPTGFRD